MGLHGRDAAFAPELTSGTLRALGLGRIGKSTEREDSPETLAGRRERMNNHMNHASPVPSATLYARARMKGAVQ